MHMQICCLCLHVVRSFYLLYLRGYISFVSAILICLCVAWMIDRWLTDFLWPAQRLSGSALATDSKTQRSLLLMDCDAGVAITTTQLQYKVIIVTSDCISLIDCSFLIVIFSFIPYSYSAYSGCSLLFDRVCVKGFDDNYKGSGDYKGKVDRVSFSLFLLQRPLHV